MASIRRLRKRWQAQIRRKGHKPVTRSFTLKSDAERWAREVEIQIERGSFKDRSRAEKTLLIEVLHKYLREVSPTKACLISDRARIGHLDGHMGHLSLAQVSRADLADYRDKRIKLVSGQSVRAELSLLNRILVKAEQEWGLELPQGIPKVKLPKKPRGRDRRLEAGELERLLNAMSASCEVAKIVQFAIETGMRRGEICNMRWKDVNFADRTLNIPETKTDTPRQIPLSSKAIEILSDQERGDNDRVWVIQASGITHAFNKACKRAGLADLRFHDLRHEATSRLFERGLSIMEVASITGHQSPEMLKRYTHLRAGDLVAKLG